MQMAFSYQFWATGVAENSIGLCTAAAAAAPDGAGLTGSSDPFCGAISSHPHKNLNESHLQLSLTLYSSPPAKRNRR